MKKILVVDDVESDRLVLRAILEDAGYEVLEVGGGEDALGECLDGEIDLVVTDLNMPDVHGLELIKVLGTLEPPPPIIAVSGTGRPSLHLANWLGATKIFEKPVDRDEFLQAVERVLGL